MDLVKGITSDYELLKLAEKLDVHIDKILVSSEISRAIPQKGTYLILLKPEDRDIGHWTAVHDGVYFDSMGEGPPPKYRLSRYNTKQLQGTYDDYCGPFCILWLYSKQHNRNDLMDRFSDLNLTIL